MTIEKIGDGDEPLDSTMSEIMDTLDASDVNRLRKLVCTQDGLFNQSIRERAWPLLVGLDPYLEVYTEELLKTSGELDAHQQHRDFEQITKDVERSFIYINSDDTREEEAVMNLKNRLSKLILNVLVSIPELNYYQGYHDVASMVVLTFTDDKEAFRFLYTLTLRYLRDHMMKGIDPTMQQLSLIPELLACLDKDFSCILEDLKPVYAISSIITLFTHDITNFEAISLIWDFIFALDDPQMILYVYVSLIMYYKDDIIIDINQMSDSSVDSKTSVYDLDVVHVVLTNFIRRHLNANSLDSKLEVFNILKLAMATRRKVSLSKLKSYKPISGCSILKSKSTSLALLKMQVEEYRKYELRVQRRKQIVAKTRLKSHMLNAPMLVSCSLGVGILGVILHFSYRQGGMKVGVRDIFHHCSSMYQQVLSKLR